MMIRSQNRSSLKPGRVVSRAEFVERAKKSYGVEYCQFWTIYWGFAPQVCPKCGSKDIKALNLALPNNRTGGKIWSKWYLWCESCLYGIYCPPGTYWLPANQPYVLWGDKDALKQALPENLRLISPKPSETARLDESEDSIVTRDVVSR